MLWLKVLKSLRDYLHASEIADAVILGGYKPGDVRPDENGKGLIFIQRDRERPASDDLVQDMRVQVSVDTWVKSSVSYLEKGYRALARLEGALMEALRRYEKETTYIADGVQLMRVRIIETGGDGDSVRPLVGSRTSLDIIVYEET